MSIDREFKNNSAGRLLQWFLQVGTRTAMYEVLGDGGESEPEKVRLALERLNEVSKEFDTFYEDVSESSLSKEQQEHFISGLQDLRNSLNPLGLQNAMRKINSTEISLLKLCGTFIPEEGEVTPNDLDVIRKSVNDLRTTLNQSSVSPTLKKCVLELIRMTEDALNRYEIRGARGLKKAFKSMLAESLEIHGYKEEIKQNPALWDQIIRHIKTVDDVASRVLKYKPYIESVAQILIGGPTP